MNTIAMIACVCTLLAAGCLAQSARPNMNLPPQPGGTNQMPHAAVSITGVVIKVEGIDVTTPERSVLPVTAKEKIREQMSLRELLKACGKGWLSPYSSIGSIQWFFQDGTVISV